MTRPICLHSEVVKHGEWKGWFICNNCYLWMTPKPQGAVVKRWKKNDLTAKNVARELQRLQLLFSETESPTACKPGIKLEGIK